MSSSLIKANYVNNTAKEGKRVIDSNQAVFDRLQLLNEIIGRQGTDEEGEFVDEFSEGLEAEQVSALFEDSEAGSDFDEGIAPPPQPSVSQADIDSIIEEANEQARIIIDEAKAEAKNIIAEAKANAEQLKSEAFATGQQEGEAAGYQEGLAKTQQLEEELNAKMQLMQQEYENQLSELEPQMVGVLTDIYSHVIGVDLTYRSQIILHLLHDTIRNIDGGHNFFVHVSPDDYSYVNENKEQLQAGLASSCVVEVIEDISLAGGSCFIEAESGIFDCSLGVELENLKKELNLLAYKA